MNSNVLLLAAIYAVTLACGHEIDNKREESDVKSQMQNTKEEKEFLSKLETKLGTKKGLPELRDVPEEIEDAFENEALPEMIENIETHHDAAEAEIDDDLEDLEDPRSNGKADARPGWPCSRRRWLGGCGTRRRTVFGKAARATRKFAFGFIRRRSNRRRRGW